MVQAGNVYRYSRMAEKDVTGQPGLWPRSLQGAKGALPPLQSPDMFLVASRY